MPSHSLLCGPAPSRLTLRLGPGSRAPCHPRSLIHAAQEANEPRASAVWSWGSAVFAGLAAAGVVCRAGSRKCCKVYLVRSYRKSDGRGVTALCSSLRSDNKANAAALKEFNTLDSNGDGVITREEFLAGRRNESGRTGQKVLDKFKQFLIESEEEGPLWYRFADVALTALGTICFVTSVVEPQVADDYRLNELEDFINVSFFIKFMLLLWTNDFEISWVFTGKGAFDLASCLPVLDIPARLLGGPALARTTDLLQIGRFLRLLRDALPSDMDDVKARTVKKLPLGQQITAVLLSLIGTLVVSATVLFSFENPIDQKMSERSFEDALVYMVNIFAGRDPPWYPVQPQAKLASVIATCCGIIFIPFLVSRTVAIFMAPFAKDDTGTAEVGPKWVFSDWISVLKRLDMLNEAGLLSTDDAKKLRKLCLQQSDQIKMLDLCYGKACSSPRVERMQCQLYASRLKEVIADQNNEFQDSET